MFRSRLPKLIFHHIVIHFRNNFFTIYIIIFLHSSEIIPQNCTLSMLMRIKQKEKREKINDTQNNKITQTAKEITKNYLIIGSDNI